MRNVQANLHFLPSPRLVPQGDAIEWEELPSLAGVVAARRLRLALQAGDDRAAAPVFSNAPVWDATRPAELEATPASEPFREPLRGLAIREVTEPEIFRHFFGALFDEAATR